MKIVKPGKVFLFACEFCGCEFKEGAYALKYAKPDLEPTLKCPCCGQDCKGVDIDKLFGRTTEETDNDHL